MPAYKRFLAAALLVCTALLLTGCWNNRPITELSIVAGMGFDKLQDGSVELTAQIVVPSKLSAAGSTQGSQSGGSAAENITVVGQTSFDAVRNLLASTNRKAYFAHVQLVAVSEAMAQDGIDKIWDIMERDNEFNRTVRVIVVRNSTAKALLEASPKLGKINAVEIANTLDSSRSFGKSVDIKAYELTDLLSLSRTGIVTGVVDPSGEKELTKMKIEGAAVLKHGRLAGYLSPDALRGYLFAANKISSTILVLPNPEEKDKKISLEVIKSTGKVSAAMKHGLPTLSIAVKTMGNLGDEQGSKNLFNEKDIALMEKEAGALIRSNITQAARASQSMHCDIFNFNDLLYKNSYGDFMKISGKWDTLYSDADITVTAQFHFDRPGMVNAPAFKP